jgi:hypothetical protein
MWKRSIRCDCSACDSDCEGSVFELETLLSFVSLEVCLLVSPLYLLDSIVLKHLDCLFQALKHCEYAEFRQLLTEGVSAAKEDASHIGAPSNFEVCSPTSGFQGRLGGGGFSNALFDEEEEPKQAEVDGVFPAPLIHLPTGRRLGIRVGT